MSKRKVKISASVCVLVLIAAACLPTFAATDKVDFPQKGKAITIIVPNAAGGINDMTARLIAPVLEKELGTPVQVVNKPGGATLIGLTEVALAKPDGHTIMECSFNAMAWRPHTQHVKYTFHDFTYILSHSDYNFAFLVRKDAPWKTFQEWLDYARKNPGVKYGSPSTFSIPHIVMEWVAKHEKIKILHAPFKGDGETAAALLGKHIDVSGSAGAAIPIVEGGQLRTLLQLCGDPPDPTPATVQRLMDVYPNFSPGLKIGVEMPMGIVGPKGMPAPVVKKLTAALKKATETEEFVKFNKQYRTSVVVWDGEQIFKNVELASDTFGKVLKDLGFVKK